MIIDNKHKTNMRIGLFGGTFNPIHLGHVQVVLEILEQYKLDYIYFIPSATPPHKNPDNVVDTKARLSMVKLAVSENKNLLVSDIEIKRQGLSYTIDTIEFFIQFFKDNHLINTKIFFLLGIDAFLEIDTWKSWSKLFMLCSFIIMPRSGKWMEKDVQYKTKVENYLNNTLFNKTKPYNKYRYQNREKCFIHKEMQTIYLSDTKLVNISSTKIRQLIKNNGKTSQMLPLKVEQYIKNTGLYK